MGDPAPRSIPAQPATPSTHASRAHLPLFSHFSLLSAHSFPSPLARRNHLVYTREAVSHALPRPSMLTRLLRLLAPLTPRRCSRLFLTLRSDRSQTGLFRSRRPHPTPSPRPRHPASLAPSSRPLTAPNLRRQPAPKTGPSYLSPARIPLWGFGLARDSSPFTPTQFPPPGTSPQPHPIPATAPCRAAPHPPASRPALATPPWQDLDHPYPAAHPRHTPVRPSPPVPWRVPASPEEHPAEPQEFFGKNSYARKPTPFHAPTRPSRGPASPRDH